MWDALKKYIGNERCENFQMEQQKSFNGLEI